LRPAGDSTMSDIDVGYLPAHRLASLIRDKSVSPVGIVEAILRRVAAVEPQVNAFAALAADQALQQARDAEQAIQRGESLGPLHGIPVTIKDLAATRGIATQRGSHLFAGVVPTEDAPFVERLKAAGAIVIGKTTTSELGWSGLSRSPLTGYTHNPWKHGHQAGASSCGAGAAAAAGYGPLHQGTDAAGSIRIPSHFCGVFGLKPTFGRVPLVPVGNLDYTSHAGPMTRDVRDAARMLSVMAGPHPEDHTSLAGPVPDFEADLEGGVRGMRIAFSANLGHARVDSEILEITKQAVSVFESLGATVEEVTPDWGPEGPELIRFFWPALMSLFARHLPQWEKQMDQGLVACIKDGMAMRAQDYQVARERKLAYCSRIGKWFEGWDLLLTPAASVAAFPVERVQPEDWPQHPWDWMQWAEFSYPFNFAGNPAASVPCGFTQARFPVGLQIVGRRFQESAVLRAAFSFEQQRPWAHMRPGLRSAAA
jgi:aspartyl-tRNA(Asn)/glutamyl-tRNA(Gln) amidotransferase subunit A